MIGFFNDYDQLIDTCLAAAGCTGDTGSTTNAGAAEIKGIEFQYNVPPVLINKEGVEVLTA